MNNYKNLLIVGASGHGKVAADIALKMNKWDEIFFLDDNQTLTEVMGIKVIGKAQDVTGYKGDYDIFVAIGNNTIREVLLKKLVECNASIPVLIHPFAEIGSNVEIGPGTIVMAGSIINCCSTIGKGVIINTASSIDHDNRIEDYVHISPGAHTAGSVLIKKGTWVGIGAVVSNGLQVAGNSIIGAGAVVIDDISEEGTYVGCPARRL